MHVQGVREGLDTCMVMCVLNGSHFINMMLFRGDIVLQLQECIGSAVIAMGPETLLTVLPISLDAKDQTCSNVWLIPILKDYVTGSSLGFFIESIVPLAESFQEACQKGTRFLDSCLMYLTYHFWQKVLDPRMEITII